MEYKNLNPELTSELLEKYGFNFDGYYYVSAICPIRFNKEEEGWMPSFENPEAPAFKHHITSYAGFLNVVLRGVQLYVQTNLIAGKNYLNEEAKAKAIAEGIHEYFSFDKNLDFAFGMAENGMMRIIPNNEYTYTILNNDSNKFKVIYSIRRDKNSEWKGAEKYYEISAACMSWPFLMRDILSDCPEHQVEIQKVSIVDGEGTEFPFFGMGIPTVHTGK